MSQQYARDETYYTILQHESHRGRQIRSRIHTIGCDGKEEPFFVPFVDTGCAVICQKTESSDEESPAPFNFDPIESEDVSKKDSNNQHILH